MKISIDINVKELRDIYANYGQATLDEAITKIAGDIGLKIKKALELPSVAISPPKVIVEG